MNHDYIVTTGDINDYDSETSNCAFQFDRAMYMFVILCVLPFCQTATA